MFGSKINIVPTVKRERPTFETVDLRDDDSFVRLVLKVRDVWQRYIEFIETQLMPYQLEWAREVGDYDDLTLAELPTIATVHQFCRAAYLHPPKIGALDFITGNNTLSFLYTSAEKMAWFLKHRCISFPADQMVLVT
ncbi:Carbohydrate kinase, FGGY, conserved site [Trema orientale]|uniref:Carbohydrate kinase, FGGY, conserved site n=1 Tax=Trema orientale TaxID=63057 RepID=A0A2P5ESU2_TREOI|nr:Carbohydrate kinase, FGGY, conserved site [Trema orientale]